jgi:hypothetical protein
MKLHWHILDKKRIDILPLLKDFSAEGFYLAGGTGLALQLGHRDSEDFDFFQKGNFDTRELIEKIEQVFKDHSISITQQERNTVSCQIDGTIKLSFFGSPYDLLKPPVKTEYFDMASLDDIACMKVLATTHRAVERDYVDLYFILHKIPLKDLLRFCSQKYKSINELLLVKSITSLDDVQKKEPIEFKEGHKISWREMNTYFQKLKVDYQQQLQSIRKKGHDRDLKR